MSLQARCLARRAELREWIASRLEVVDRLDGPLDEHGGHGHGDEEAEEDHQQGPRAHSDEQFESLLLKRL